MLGAIWDVKIMPIKILQASGIGDAATIALGVDYATNNGATILNMSFGAGWSSITLKNALANAYAGSERFLVAAAGNNGLPLPPCVYPQLLIILLPMVLFLEWKLMRHFLTMIAMAQYSQLMQV